MSPAVRPKGVTFSSSGVGTTPHLAGELFGHRAGLKTVHVPFRSSATTEVMSGTIDFAIDNVASYTSFIKAGKVRALAVTAAERWPVLPEVPTMAEAGIPDFVFMRLRGCLGRSSIEGGDKDAEDAKGNRLKFEFNPSTVFFCVRCESSASSASGCPT